MAGQNKGERHAVAACKPDSVQRSCSVVFTAWLRGPAVAAPFQAFR
jgi:hypothetical protein